jgi:DeoR family transcriptional regulator of aga operon
MDVVVLGGMLRKSYYSSFGPYARYVLENLRADKAFLGVDAASKETGVTNAALEEIPIKQTMIEVSNETIMVTDSTKFYTHVPYRVCGWDKIDWIVTDDGVGQDYVDFFKQQGLKVTLVHPVRDNDDV